MHPSCSVPHNTLSVQPHQHRSARRFPTFGFVFLLCCIAGLGSSNPTRAAKVLPSVSRPAVLFLVHSRKNAFTRQLDRRYLQELQRKLGLQIGVESLHKATARKLRQFDAVVMYQEVGSATETNRRIRGNRRRFARMIASYAKRGGGVFLLPFQIQRSSPFPLLSKTFQFRLSRKTLLETDPRKRSTLQRGSIPVPIGWTSSIARSSVSAGVRQVWYQYGTSRLGRQTGAIRLLSRTWKPVVRASSTAYTAVRRKRPNGSYVMRKTRQRSPVLFAIRSYGRGRIALYNTWYHGIFGQGTKWVFNRQILSRGSKGKPSHVHRLVVNTLRWLTTPGKLRPRSQRRRLMSLGNNPRMIRQRFALREKQWNLKKVMRHRKARNQPRSFRGIVGVRSRYSSGRSTLRQYQQAALRNKIDFLVFFEDYSRLTSRKFRRFVREARRLSNNKVQLIPGYRMKTNTGNYVFVYGKKAPWIPSRFVRRDGTLKLQPENARKQLVFDQRLFNWILHTIHGTTRQFGFYRFSQSSRQGLKVKDLRLYSALGVSYYQGTRRVEQLFQEYIQSSSTGLPPTPLSITEITHAQMLPKLLQRRVPLTYVAERKLSRVAKHLGWDNVYSAARVSVSNGPIIQSFPSSFFYRTLGAQIGITGRAMQPVHVTVSSPHPIQHIVIYNNGRIYRSIRPQRRTRRWSKTLLLPGNLQKNLLLWVKDARGGVAISSVNRSVKDAHGDVVFCGDHVNDCNRNPVLARGTFQLPIHFSPKLLVDEAGFGWDGGPVGAQDLASARSWNILKTRSQGKINTNRYNQSPFLHYSDEGSIGVRSVADEEFAPQLHRPLRLPLNPWFGYAPKSKSRVLRRENELRIWKQLPDSMPQDGHLFYGGSRMSLGFWHTWSFVFQQTVDLRWLALWGLSAKPTVPYSVIVSGYKTPPHALKPGAKRKKYSVSGGGWFALYSSTPGTNSHLFFNLGREPYQLDLRYGRIAAFVRPRSKKQWARGSRLQGKLVSYAFGVKTPIATESAMRAYANYLYKIPKPLMRKGGLRGLRGLVTMIPQRGVVSFVHPRAPRSVRDLGLGFRVKGLIPYWSAGLLQKSGYVARLLRSSRTYRKPATYLYRPLGIDPQGSVWFPLNVAAATHNIEAGHPVVASWRGKLVTDVAIQVTHLQSKPNRWYIAVNHLGQVNRTLTFKLISQMNLPQFPFRCVQVTLKPHQHLIVHQFNQRHPAVRRCR